MTYVVDITLSLTRALERASFFRDERLKGHAANATFWASEVRHALDVIESSEARFAAWQQATGDASGSPPIRPEDLAKLKGRLIADATRFSRLCRPYLERAPFLKSNNSLGNDIEHVSQVDLE